MEVRERQEEIAIHERGGGKGQQQGGGGQFTDTSLVLSLGGLTANPF